MYYVKKISSFNNSDELYSYGIGAFAKKIDEMGMSVGQSYVIEPSACLDYLNSKENKLCNLLEDEVLHVVHDMEKEIVGGTELGKYSGDEKTGHFLTLKISFGSRARHQQKLPVIRNVGAGIGTLCPFGDNVVTWTRDVYLNFIADYALYCCNMPRRLYDEILDNYDNQDLNSIVNAIEKVDSWYTRSFGKLILNTNVGIPYESIFEVIKAVYDNWGKENVYENTAKEGCSVLIEPMFYGNKDCYSGYGYCELLPNSLDARLFDRNASLFKGYFLPTTQKVVRASQMDNILQNDFVCFKNDPYNMADNIINDVKMFANFLFEYDLNSVLRCGEDTLKIFQDNVSGYRMYYVVESGRVRPDFDELIPKLEERNREKELVKEENDSITVESEYHEEDYAKLKSCVHRIVQEKTESVLIDGNLFVSLISDLVPEAKKEILLIKRVFASPAREKLYHYFCEKDVDKKEVKLNILKCSLSDEWINDNGINTIIEIFK